MECGEAVPCKLLRLGRVRQVRGSPQLYECHQTKLLADSGLASLGEGFWSQTALKAAGLCPASICN